MIGSPTLTAISATRRSAGFFSVKDKLSLVCNRRIKPMHVFMRTGDNAVRLLLAQLLQIVKEYPFVKLIDSTESRLRKSDD